MNSQGSRPNKTGKKTSGNSTLRANQWQQHAQIQQCNSNDTAAKTHVGESRRRHPRIAALAEPAASVQHVPHKTRYRDLSAPRSILRPLFQKHVPFLMVETTPLKQPSPIEKQQAFDCISSIERCAHFERRGRIVKQHSRWNFFLAVWLLQIRARLFSASPRKCCSPRARVIAECAAMRRAEC